MERDQRYCEQAAGEQKPVLRHVEQGLRYPPVTKQMELPADAIGVPSRNIPKVKIVTGQGVTPNMGMAG